MLQTLNRVWWLLAVGGFLDGLLAVWNLLMMNPDGSRTLRRYAPTDAVWGMSLLAVVSGGCAIAAGLGSAGRRCWLLVLHGLALGAFGMVGISPLVKGPLSFRPISLLFVVMAVSAGVLAFQLVRTERMRGWERWLLVAVGTVALGFGVSFLLVGFGWMRLGPPYAFWIWMSSDYALYGAFLLYLAMRARGEGVSRTDHGDLAPSMVSPRPAL